MPAGADAAADGGTIVDGGDDACVSPDGVYAVCNGALGCFPPNLQRDGTVCEACTSPSSDEVGLCTSSKVSLGGATAVDGQVNIAPTPWAPNVWWPFPYEVGVLFANSGGASRVRYADFKPWTGAPLPEPSTCPTFSSFRICGGNCGACKVDEWCVGRSPDHPWGLCVPTWGAAGGCGTDKDGGWGGCGAGHSCFVFQAGDGQPFADKDGFCMDTAGCQAAATSYPGGGFCHATP